MLRPGDTVVLWRLDRLGRSPRHLIDTVQALEARGRSGGRPTVWTPEKLEVAREMYQSREHDVATIVRVAGVSRASIYRALSQPNTSKSLP